MGVVYRFYINPFYHVTKIAMDFTAYRRISPNDYRDFPILLEQNLKSASNLNGNLNCSKELEHYAS